MKIKSSESFFSFQGEGRFFGVPSIFLRTFGCNFTCAGFGMPKGQLSVERHNVDPSKYKNFKDLPLVSTGCDSYASWDPRFKDFSKFYTTDEIAEDIYKLIPGNKFGDRVHLVITGGEPLLSWQRAYPELLEKMQDLRYLTFETNGTQKIQDELHDYLCSRYLRTYDDLTFSVSPKLPNSGMKWSKAIKKDVIAGYQSVGHTYLKFVIGDEEDVKHAEQAVEELEFKGDVYYMPVGGVDSVYYMHERDVAELALKNCRKFTPRLQVILWKNAWGT